MATQKKSESVVKAVTSFMDAKTGRDYRPGDVIVGWEMERAQHYADVGLVEIVTPPDPPASGGKDEEEKPKTSTRRKPGPSVTKPRSTSKTEK